MTLFSTLSHCTSTPTVCIYDAYMVIRRTCNYRDSTLTKNHPIIYITHLSHLPSYSYLHLSCLSLTPMVITSSPYTYLHPSIYSHTLSSLYHTQRLGLASLFITLKSYLNTYERELGHLCPSGILRSISLSPTTCLSTWRYHCLFITTSLLVQVGLITLRCLFNAVGTIINPHLELIQSSYHQDPSSSNMHIESRDVVLPGKHHPFPPLPYLRYTHQTGIPLDLPTLSPTLLPCTTYSWTSILEHVHLP